MASSKQFVHCEICPIIENPSPQALANLIHEGEAWRVSLDDNQAQLGAAYIALKDHKSGLEELSEDEDREFITIRNRLITALDAAFAPDGVNLACLMNLAFRPNGDPNFAPQPHVHYIMRPRYSQLRTVAGATFTDPEFGGYLRIRRNQRVAPEVGSVIAARIRESF